MRLGFVGAGDRTRLRADCYERLPNVTIGGIVAPDSAPDWAPKSYDNITALLDGEVLDAVDVCDPNDTQLGLVRACLNAGVGVICPTPLTNDLEEATTIQDIAEQADARVLVDGFHKFARENQDAKERIDADEIGKPTTVRTVRRLPTVDSSDQNGTMARDTVLRYALFLDIAKVRWLFGDIEQVFTRIGADKPAEKDRLFQAVTIARFASGAIGHFEVRVGNRHDRVTVDFEYSGTEGRLSYSSEEFSALEVTAPIPIEPGLSEQLRRSRPSSDLHDRHAEHVVACLRDNTEPVQGLAESVETLRTVLAAVESAQRDAPKAVAEVSI